MQPVYQGSRGQSKKKFDIYNSKLFLCKKKLPQEIAQVINHSNKLSLRNNIQKCQNIKRTLRLMKYLTCPPEKSMQIIDDYLVERLSYLDGKDRNALVLEFKEWIVNGSKGEDNVWSIPDLTDEGLCDFFKRAISRK